MQYNETIQWSPVILITQFHYQPGMNFDDNFARHKIFVTISNVATDKIGSEIFLHNILKPFTIISLSNLEISIRTRSFSLMSPKEPMKTDLLT